ncbi:ABC transporter permease [Roseibium marinum]|uniref:Peptide/nickel transport system permease protein n=1 Tax=Roseibium marinum TaxID=281252 RepID=A0A2S3UKN0_9HYPH|nr:ABC transporter permease [Roseibium marinum]POF28130.1 peptide/nickel transport system permease protein [Roseibium marinum]
MVEVTTVRKAAGTPWSLRLAAGWLILVLILALVGPAFAPYGVNEQDFAARFAPPVLAGGTWAHPFGTDQIGRDLFSRLINAIRISLLLALLGTLIGMVIGSVLGMIAAHFRGWIEDVIMALVDFQAALPFIIFAIAALAVFEAGFWTFLLILGIAGWERYARLVRALVLQAQNDGYADALDSLGAHPVRIYLWHILPNIFGAVSVQMTINFPETILLETGLSFLGIGIQPPHTSLGLLVSDGRPYIFQAIWLVAFPGAAIFLTTLSVSLLGDRARDRADILTRKD